MEPGHLQFEIPERFAAIMPDSAVEVIRMMFVLLKDVPVWVFHGEKDDIVPIR